MTARRTLAERYELTSPIGRGGMGEVWSGYDKRLDRSVAVKLLRPDVLPLGSDHTTLAKRFLREARLTARVEHQGVPAVFDAGAEGNELYLVMQLVPGMDLGDFLVQHQPVPVTWAAAVAAQVASVLAAAHALSLVHRDLKPGNVMVKPDGTVTVLDFGVATLLETDLTRLTTTGEAVGSPAYMSPEQVLGGVPSPRSDLYALGCILHELLAGTRPFTAEGTYPAMRQHVEEPPPPLRTQRADTPVEIEELVLHLLAKAPEDRPADAQEVYERLLPFLPTPRSGVRSDAPSSPSDPTRPYRQPFAPRGRGPRVDRCPRRFELRTSPARATRRPNWSWLVGSPRRRSCWRTSSDTPVRSNLHAPNAEAPGSNWRTPCCSAATTPALSRSTNSLSPKSSPNGLPTTGTSCTGGCRSRLATPHSVTHPKPWHAWNRCWKCGNDNSVPPTTRSSNCAGRRPGCRHRRETRREPRHGFAHSSPTSVPHIREEASYGRC